MAKNTQIIEVKTTGATKSKKQIQGVNNGLKNMAKQAAIAASAYFGTRALLGAIKSSIDLFAKQELAEKKLESALGKTSQSLLNHASALQKVTMFGDETIIEAQALIGAFVKDEEAIKLATEATLDLAAAKGFDLVGAADLVSKTLGSSTNALSRYGIEVVGAVGSTERLESLTGNLAAVFGGQAAAQAQTLTGAMAQLNNSFGDLQETIASEFAPQITSAAQSVTTFIDSITTSLKLNQLDAFMATEAYKALGDQAKLSNLEAKKGLLETQLLLEENPGLVKQVSDAYFDYFLNTKNVKMATEAFAPELFTIYETFSTLFESVFGTNDVLEVLSETLGTDTEKIEELKEMIAELVLEMELFSEGAILVNEGLKDQGKSVSELDKLWKNFIKTRQEAAKLAKEQSKAEDFYTKKFISDLQLAGKESKAFKSVWKAAAISKAIVDTYEGAGAAFKALAGIPIVGPALGIAAEIAAIAAGMARVKQIKAAQYGADFVTSGPQLMMVGEGSGPEHIQVTPLVDDNKFGPQGGGGITLNISGNVLHESFIEEEVIPQIREGLRLGENMGV